MSESVQFNYTGSTPGADSDTYVLFSSVAAFPGARFHSMYGLKRFHMDVKHNNTGTINLYKSTDRGVTWLQVNTTSAAATGSTASDVYDALVDEYPDFKVEWVNGGSAQSTWSVTGSLSSGHAAST